MFGEEQAGVNALGMNFDRQAKVIITFSKEVLQYKGWFLLRIDDTLLLCILYRNPRLVF